MMKLPAREGKKLLGLVRDKIPFFRVYPESKEIGSELESIQSGGGYLYLSRGMLVFWVRNFFLSFAKN